MACRSSREAPSHYAATSILDAVMVFLAMSNTLSEGEGYCVLVSAVLCAAISVLYLGVLM